MRRWWLCALCALALLAGCDSGKKAPSDGGDDGSVDGVADGGDDGGVDGGDDGGLADGGDDGGVEDGGDDGGTQAGPPSHVQVNSGAGGMQSARFRAHLRVGGPQPADRASGADVELKPSVRGRP